MRAKKRQPVHPGIILEEHYIKPLGLNLQVLADHLRIARNTLFKIRIGRAGITPSIAIALAEAFDTTPHLWLNLQQKYDVWSEEHLKDHERIKPIYKAGVFFPLQSNYSRKHRERGRSMDSGCAFDSSRSQC